MIATEVRSPQTSTPEDLENERRKREALYQENLAKITALLKMGALTPEEYLRKEREFHTDRVRNR